VKTRQNLGRRRKRRSGRKNLHHQLVVLGFHLARGLARAAKASVVRRTRVAENEYLSVIHTIAIFFLRLLMYSRRRSRGAIIAKAPSEEEQEEDDE
jgi:hypothetical protein